MELTKENIFKDNNAPIATVIPVGRYAHKSTGHEIEVLKICGKYIEIRLQGLLSVRQLDFLKEYVFIPSDGSLFH